MLTLGEESITEGLTLSSPLTVQHINGSPGCHMVNWDQGQNPSLLAPLPLIIPPLRTFAFPAGQQTLKGDGNSSTLFTQVSPA